MMRAERHRFGVAAASAPLISCAAAVLVAGCAPSLDLGPFEQTYRYGAISTGPIAYARPAVTHSTIAYDNRRSSQGFRNNEVRGTQDAFYREFDLYVRGHGLDWSPLEGMAGDSLHGFLQTQTDTLYRLPEPLRRSLAAGGTGFIILIYDMQLVHRHAVSAANYGGSVYGANVMKTLFYRCSLFDVERNALVLYFEKSMKMRGTGLGLMEWTVRDLFSVLLRS